MSKLLESKKIPKKIINDIFDIIKPKAVDNFDDPIKRRTTLLENMTLRIYMRENRISATDCRIKINNAHPELQITDNHIIGVSGNIGMHNLGLRISLTDWSYGIVRLIYNGMAGDVKSLKKAKVLIAEPCGIECRRRIPQEKLVFFSMFEYIPELRKSPYFDSISYIRRDEIRIILNRIISVLIFDIDETESNKETANIEELKREVYLARNELKEYQALVEAKEAEDINKIEELTNQNISEFFAGLNNEKYGYIIDTVFLFNKACIQLNNKKTPLPYSIQGLPALLERILRFLRDAGISPACKYAPGSVVRLTLEEMEGFCFEPSATRKTPIAPGEKVEVSVFSSGWKYKGNLISLPVVHEIDKKGRT